MNVEVEKRGLMVQFPCARGRKFVCKNIGDYIQAIATRQFVDSIDEYIEQEEADQYFPKDKKRIRLIMNGWFQWRAENWPPSEYVHPLLVSMHISPLKATQLLSDKGIQFLRQNGPVGCRDTGTMKLLEKYNIPAYFSACMTLTLGRTYRIPENDRKGVYFVDPYFDFPKSIVIDENGKKVEWKNLVIETIYILKHYSAVKRLAKHSFFNDYLPTGFLDRNKFKYKAWYKAAAFYRIYSKKFTKELLLNAQYITHWIDVDMSGKVNNNDLLNYAESLVKKYASAKLLITSRIHAGLPALGLETPVIFIANSEITEENGKFNTPGRLGGLLELFRVMNLEGEVFSSEDKLLNIVTLIGDDFKISNKSDWKKYADELAVKCEEFMS